MPNQSERVSTMRITWKRALGSFCVLFGSVLYAHAQTGQQLLVGHVGTSGVLGFDAASGAFVGPFVSAAGGGLVDTRGMTFGPDSNLYVSSGGTNSVLRFNGTTASSSTNSSRRRVVGCCCQWGSLLARTATYTWPVGLGAVLRYNGTTGAFMGVFAVGGLSHAQ
jgi:hypothetical protein